MYLYFLFMLFDTPHLHFICKPAESPLAHVFCEDLWNTTWCFAGSYQWQQYLLLMHSWPISTYDKHLLSSIQCTVALVCTECSHDGWRRSGIKTLLLKKLHVSCDITDCGLFPLCFPAPADVRCFISNLNLSSIKKLVSYEHVHENVDDLLPQRLLRDKLIAHEISVLVFKSCRTMCLCLCMCPMCVCVCMHLCVCVLGCWLTSGIVW